MLPSPQLFNIVSEVLPRAIGKFYYPYNFSANLKPVYKIRSIKNNNNLGPALQECSGWDDELRIG